MQAVYEDFLFEISHGSVSDKRWMFLESLNLIRKVILELWSRVIAGLLDLEIFSYQLLSTHC